MGIAPGPFNSLRILRGLDLPRSLFHWTVVKLADQWPLLLLWEKRGGGGKTHRLFDAAVCLKF